jgi:hypothetical protein
MQPASDDRQEIDVGADAAFESDRDPKFDTAEEESARVRPPLGPLPEELEGSS